MQADTPQQAPPTDARRYRIRVRGRLSQHFAHAFDGMALEQDAEGTVLVGDIVDQAHLYGVIDRLRDFGVELTSLEEVAR